MNMSVILKIVLETILLNREKRMESKILKIFNKYFQNNNGVLIENFDTFYLRQRYERKKANKKRKREHSRRKKSRRA